jgi:hypothetical protein
MKRRSIAATAMLALTISAGSLSAQSGPNAFTFVGWGDVPYKLPDDYPKVDRLIAAINKAKPAFSLHVGDTKDGSSPCTDEVLKKAYDQMMTVEVPLVYTIGDNEWVDCHRKSAGGYDPRERLAKVREIFFAKPGVSMGKTPMAVESQGKLDPKFAKFVENQRFVHNGVVFVTPHVIGSNNGLESLDPKSGEEFYERDKANVAWLNEAFRLARERNAPAMVIWFQAALYDVGGRSVPAASGHYNTVDAIAKGAQAFGKPVLVMHGDHHIFEMAMFLDTRMKPVPNVIRLQLWGEDKVQGMRVTVDPDMPGVFSFAPLIVPENGPM